jgi:hypothetical protein
MYAPRTAGEPVVVTMLYPPNHKTFVVGIVVETTSMTAFVVVNPVMEMSAVP